MQPERRQTSRRESDRESGLFRDDLFLLMEAYRNTIELNTTLLERQDAINQGLERVLRDVSATCETQAELIAVVNNNRLAEAAEHSRHTTRLYGAFAALTSIILALIALIVKIWPGGG